MSPLVEVTGVGAFIKPADSDRYRPFTHGDRVSVSEEDAARLVAAGGIALVDASAPAENAEGEAPDPGAIAVSDLDLEEGGTSVVELRRFASARRINLQGATRRPEIAAAIEASLTDPDGGS